MAPASLGRARLFVFLYFLSHTGSLRPLSGSHVFVCILVLLHLKFCISHRLGSFKWLPRPLPGRLSLAGVQRVPRPLLPSAPTHAQENCVSTFLSKDQHVYTALEEILPYQIWLGETFLSVCAKKGVKCCFSVP